MTLVSLLCGAGILWPAVQHREAMGQSMSEAGTLLVHRAKSWEVLPPHHEILPTDRLLALPGDNGVIAFKDDALRLTLWGSLRDISPGLLLGTEASIQGATGDGVDATLERGRLVISTPGGHGPARVRLHFHDQDWRLALEPQTDVAVELYRRWPAEATFNSEARPHEQPLTTAVLWMLQGQAELTVGGEHFSLTAPPGPAVFRWDNVRGPDAGPHRRDQRPAWADTRTALSPEAVDLQKASETIRRRLATQPLDQALAESLRADSARQRELAVYDLTALGHLSELVAALENEHHVDVRHAAFRALREWTGQGFEQSLALYRFLIQGGACSPRQAEIALHLVRGLPAIDRRQPETYEALIAYLRSDKRIIRELAYEQLTEWVPAGRSIPFDAAAPAAERERAYQEWKKLIPEHQLPPRSDNSK